MPKVVTCLLTNEDDKLLVLKRSNKVKTYRGMWGGVAGYVEKNEEPIDTAYKEIYQEVGLSKGKVKLIKKGNSIKFSDVYKGNKYDWEIFPFLFKTEKKSKIQIDWEHSSYRWLSPPEIEKINTVPRFKDTVKKFLE